MIIRYGLTKSVKFRYSDIFQVNRVEDPLRWACLKSWLFFSKLYKLWKFTQCQCTSLLFSFERHDWPCCAILTVLSHVQVEKDIQKDLKARGRFPACSVKRTNIVSSLLCSFGNCSKTLNLSHSFFNPLMCKPPQEWNIIPKVEKQTQNMYALTENVPTKDRFI